MTDHVKYFSNSLSVGGLIPNFSEGSIGTSENPFQNIFISDEVKLEESTPGMQMENYDFYKLRAYLKKIQRPNKNTKRILTAYEHGTPLTGFGTMGAYSPGENKVYLVSGESTATEWYYIDCNDNKVVGYNLGSFSFDIKESGAYNGAVYCPANNKIYFIPSRQIKSSTKLHYIDCGDCGVMKSYNKSPQTNLTGTVSVTAGTNAVTGSGTLFTSELVDDQVITILGEDFSVTVINDTSLTLSSNHVVGASAVSTVKDDYVFTSNSPYSSGSYSPKENRIYLLPDFRVEIQHTTWHYIDCDNDILVEYTHGVDLSKIGNTSNQYSGSGAYSPTEDKIYIIPARSAFRNTWMYIDCSSNTPGNAAIVEYNKSPQTNLTGTVSVTAGTNAVTGSGTLFTSELVDGQVITILGEDFSVTVTNDTSLTLSSNHVVGASAVSTVKDDFIIAHNAFAYIGGVYSPTENKIYLSPYDQSLYANWHYIDCLTGNLVEYAHGVDLTKISSSAFAAGQYSPTENKIYLGVTLQAYKEKWAYIDCNDGSVVLFNRAPQFKLTGTVSVTAGTNAVTGVGTFFTSELVNNRLIVIEGEDFKVTVVDDTNLTLSSVHVAGASGVTALTDNLEFSGRPFSGTAYCCSNNTIYLAPYSQRAKSKWYYIKITSAPNCSQDFGSSILVNK